MNAPVAPPIFPILDRFMKLDPAEFTEEKKNQLESFFAHCAEGMDHDSQKLLATLLIKALNKRIHSESIGENIYLGKYEISQIQLFNILIEKFPFVKYSQQITNRAMAEAMEGHEEATLIDIGIGQGTQMLHFIEMAAEQLPGLKKLHIVGIEPFGDALARAGEQILACNGHVPFRISFTPIHDAVEKVDFQKIGFLPGIVIVNASLALHHIQASDQRDATLARIRQINPDAFFLIEPNVDHYEPDFQQRYANCYNHFYALFQVIDRLDIGRDEKNALKLFFGREIEDIIGKEEKDRYEKHEPASRWIGRLAKNRFSIKTDFLPSAVDPGFGVEINFHPEGFLGFTFEEETALAVIYAR